MNNMDGSFHGDHPFRPTYGNDIVPRELDSLPKKQSRSLRFNKTLMIILLCCVVLLPVVLGILYLIPPLTVEGAVWKWERYLIGHEILTENMAPVEYWDYLAEKTGQTRRAVISDAQRSSAAYFKSEYISSIHFSLETVSKGRVDPETCPGLMTFLQTIGIDKNRIHNLQQLVVQASYEGSRYNSEVETHTYFKSAYAVQIDLFWYIVVHDQEGGYCFLAGLSNSTGY